jgi:hypothetical protein
MAIYISPFSGGLAARGAHYWSVDDLCCAQRGRLSLHAALSARSGGRLFALLRNEGGSIGASMVQTIEQRRLQFHVSRIG